MGLCYTPGQAGERIPAVSAKPGRQPSTSLMFRLRLPKVLSELEAAVRDAEEQAWDQGDRKRAADIAIALAGACRIEGLRDAATTARSLGCLMLLSAEQIRPIEGSLKEKVREILAFLRMEADRALTETG